MRRSIEERDTVGIKITSTSKREGNDLSYVTKLGAYGLAGVAAFAVAVALLLSVSSTPTAEAVVEDAADGTSGSQTVTKSNGDTVYIRFNNDGFATFEISTTGAASASFTHADASEDGQSITCGVGAEDTKTCDANPGDSAVTVALKIDDDSGKGNIFVKQTSITGGTAETTDAITVAVAQVPTRLTVKLADESINAVPDGAEAGVTTVDIRLLDEDNKGIAEKNITVVSSRALLSAADPLAATIGGNTVNVVAFPGTGTLAGTVATSEDEDGTANVDEAGWVRVTVTGGGSPGISTITATVGELSTSADLVLHGKVKTISAEAEQSAIEVGGSTLIVVTALDSAGNPVKDQVARLKGTGGITPPERLATKVSVGADVNKDTDSDGTEDKGDIPSCTAHDAADAVPADPNANPPTAAVDAEFASSGTNDAGQCTIEVSAPNPSGTANDAARGTHTITIVAGTSGTSPRGVNEVSVEIQVGGPPASIESDAPERIDPSSEITVNVTVVDDEGVRVGGTKIEVFQTAGDGKIITEIKSRTSDGRAKFTYLAPSTPGVAEFLVRTRADSNDAVTASLPIIVQIAEEAPPAPPAPPPPPAPAASVSGQSGLISVSADSLEALLGALDCGGNAGTTVTLNGGPYVVGAPSVVNAAFSANVEFPLGPTGAYVSCR